MSSEHTTTDDSTDDAPMPLEQLSRDKQEELISAWEDYQNSNDTTNVRRRGFLQAGAALLAGGAIGGGAYALSSEEVAAAANEVGQIGEPGSLVDVYGEDIEAVSVDTDSAVIGPQLEHIGTLSDSSLNQPHDIEVKDGVGIVPGKGGNASMIELHPRTAPTVNSTTTSFTDAQSVAFPQNDYAGYVSFVGDDSGIRIMLTQPGNYAALNTISLTGTQLNGFAWYHSDTQAARDYLFAAHKSGEVSATRVDDIDSATVRNESTATSIGSPHDVAMVGTRAVVCDQGAGANPQLSVLNVISGSSTAVDSTWSEDTTFYDASLDGANRLEVLGNSHLLVAANYTTKLAAIRTPDITDSNTWTITDSVDSASAAGPSGLSLVGDYAITASEDHTEIWDVSEPSSISLVDRYEKTGFDGHDVAVDGRYLYVTGQATNTVEVFDLGYDHGVLTQARDLAGGSA